MGVMQQKIYMIEQKRRRRERRWSHEKDERGSCLRVARRARARACFARRNSIVPIRWRAARAPRARACSRARPGRRFRLGAGRLIGGGGGERRWTRPGTSPSSSSARRARRRPRGRRRPRPRRGCSASASRALALERFVGERGRAARAAAAAAAAAAARRPRVSRTMMRPSHDALASVDDGRLRRSPPPARARAPTRPCGARSARTTASSRRRRRGSTRAPCGPTTRRRRAGRRRRTTSRRRRLCSAARSAPDVVPTTERGSRRRRRARATPARRGAQRAAGSKTCRAGACRRGVRARARCSRSRRGSSSSKPPHTHVAHDVVCPSSVCVRSHAAAGEARAASTQGAPSAAACRSRGVGASPSGRSAQYAPPASPAAASPCAAPSRERQAFPRRAHDLHLARAARGARVRVGRELGAPAGATAPRRAAIRARTRRARRAPCCPRARPRFARPRPRPRSAAAARARGRHVPHGEDAVGGARQQRVGLRGHEGEREHGGVLRVVWPRKPHRTRARLRRRDVPNRGHALAVPAREGLAVGGPREYRPHLRAVLPGAMDVLEHAAIALRHIPNKHFSHLAAAREARCRQRGVRDRHDAPAMADEPRDHARVHLACSRTRASGRILENRASGSD